MEYTFISVVTFNYLVNNYINNMPICKQNKALVNLELLNKIKTILLDPKNNQIYDKNTHKWAKKQFYLEEVIFSNYRVIVKVDNKPILIVENMYEVLCRIHAEVN